MIRKHAVPPKILESIGDFVVSFAQMEDSIKQLIQTILSCSDAHKGLVTARRQISDLIVMLREVYRVTDNQRVPFEIVDKFCSDAEKLCEFRNTLMHSTVFSQDEDTIVLENRNRKKFKFGTKEIDVVTIKENTNNVNIVAGGLLGIAMGYHTITPRTM